MPFRQIPLFDEPPVAPTLRELAARVRFEGIDGLSEAIRRADDARYQEVTVRSALTEAKGMPFRWALNPYRGCTHACQYCYARKYQRHLELGAGDDFSSLILIKQNLPDILAAELGRPSWNREPVAVGTATDPYQPVEGQQRITARCLEVLADAATPFSVITKGPMIVRDVDIFARATRGAGCQVFVSVPSVNEAAARQLEPGTAPPVQRLRAARVLQDAGIDVGILMMPLMPGITTSRDAIGRTIDAIQASGLRLAGASVARLDPGVREFFLEFLDRCYPELSAGYRRLYRATRAPEGYLRQVRAVIDRAKHRRPSSV